MEIVKMCKEDLGKLTEVEKNKLRLDISDRTVKFEIEHFWKRSLFFWGFTVVAFVAFEESYNSSTTFAVIIANFGLMSSFTWSLVNRSNKFWQENWEQHMKEDENKIIGPLFCDVKEASKKDPKWIRGRRFSPSKLVIFFSDYVTFLWFFIILNIFLNYFGIGIEYSYKIILFTIFTISWAIITLIFSKGKSD